MGNVGRNFLAILDSHGELLRERYGFEAVVVGVADSSGIAFAPDGLSIRAILEAKGAGRGIAGIDGHDRAGADLPSLIGGVDADLLLEATPTNIETGQPGLDAIRAALARGMRVVMASKGPLVVAYDELAAASDLRYAARPALRFSGAVGGALPSINAGRRDLAGARITRVEAVLNATTQIILGLMAKGVAYDEALAKAQREGIAETNPALDVEGWDAAAKLVILANAVLGQLTRLADIAVTGIVGVGVDALRGAEAAGGRISLLAVAELLPASDGPSGGDRYRLSVAPTALPREHPLAHLDLDEMGIVYHTDIYGRLTIASADQGPLGTAAAMLRDVLEITAAS